VKVYKVVKERSSGKLVSAFATGNFELTYPVGKPVSALPELAELGWHPMAFRYKEDDAFFAENFDRVKIYEAEAEGVKPARRTLMNRPLMYHPLRVALNRWRRARNRGELWYEGFQPPKRSVFCEQITLVREVPDQEWWS